MSFKFIKTKKFWFILIAILLVGSYVLGQYQKSKAPIKYDTATVVRGNLVQTVEATGKIQSSNDLALRFEAAGTVGEVKVKEGDKVKAGDVLMTLKASDLAAVVAQAQANLNQKIAGSNQSQRDYYKAAVDSASADYAKTQADIANSIATYEAAVNTARANLKMAEGGENSQIVNQAYESAVALLQASLSKLDDALTQADNILGVDNVLGNDSFESYLSTMDNTKLNIARNNYTLAKSAKDKARQAVVGLVSTSDHALVDTGLNEVENALTTMNQLLLNVSDVLNASVAGINFTQATLDAKKTTIETTRASVTGQYTSVITQKQTIANAKNSYTAYQVAYNKAVDDYNNAKSTAASTIAIKEAYYNQALANYQNQVNPPREVDLAPLRAALSQASANYAKTILRAPMDGVIAKVNKKVGELLSSADVAVNFMSPHFEIEVDIPETDVSKLTLNNSSTITLDAFGDDVKFTGKIVSIDPASTEIQDVVYYKVKVTLDDTDKPIKSGMTANVTVNTAARENVLYIPTRSVLTNAEGKYTRVLKDNKVIETPVKIGLKGDDGKIEILEGVNEGDVIVLSTTATK